MATEVKYCNDPKLISGLVDRAFATDTVDSDTIPSRVKPKTVKIDIHGFTARHSSIKRAV